MTLQTFTKHLINKTIYFWESFREKTALVRFSWTFEISLKIKNNVQIKNGLCQTAFETPRLFLLIYFTVERTGEYKYRHEWLLADKDVAQEQTPNLKRFNSNQIHQKWIPLIAEIENIVFLFIYVIIFKTVTRPMETSINYQI